MAKLLSTNPDQYHLLGAGFPWQWFCSRPVFRGDDFQRSHVGLRPLALWDSTIFQRNELHPWERDQLESLGVPGVWEGSGGGQTPELFQLMNPDLVLSHTAASNHLSYFYMRKHQLFHSVVRLCYQWILFGRTNIIWLWVSELLLCVKLNMMRNMIVRLLVSQYFAT